MTDVAAQARRALFGTTLEDKLAPWGPVEMDRGSNPLTKIDAPGRPSGLVLPTGRRDVFVRKADLQTEHGRAAVLHELANHELQAIELIALALLRWPEAPVGFRTGLVATLADEQRHCALYLARLEQCGGQFGQVPPSRFFWDTLSPVQEVKAFVAGLSLCFEAANLDFCRFWSQRFATAGDLETAAVLDVVHDDEIRHVAHGHGWFRRWSDEKGPAGWVEDWKASLPSPLTPSRARGPAYDGPGRRAAGFSPEAIAAFRVLGGSRGRPPRVLQFDAGIEARVSGRAPNKISRQVTSDLASLPMFLAGSADVVLAPSPGVPLLNALADAGFTVPRFVPEAHAISLGEHPIAAFVPWGCSPAALPVLETRTPTLTWDPAFAALSSKTESHRRAEQLEHPAMLDSLGEVWSSIGEPPSGEWVIKAPFSTSGTDRIRGKGALSEGQQSWVERFLSSDDEVLVQSWHDRVLDLSVHVDVEEDGVRIAGLTRFETRRGVYAGAHLGRWNQDLPPELQRWLHTPGAEVEALLRDAGSAAGRWAQSLGYRGPISIDAMVVSTGTGWAVHPWLETNARNTLGRVALALSGRIAPRSRAFWHVQRSTEENLSSLVDAQLSSPVVMENARIASGVLPTTEPGVALLTWIEVSPGRP